MLTDRNWNEIRTAVDEVVDRQVDEIVTTGCRVRRESDGSIIVRLEQTAHVGGLDLEPMSLKQATAAMARDRCANRRWDEGWGPGWPD